MYKDSLGTTSGYYLVYEHTNRMWSLISQNMRLV